MPKDYTIHCPNCGIELGKVKTGESSGRYQCRGCNITLWVGAMDNQPAHPDVTMQYPVGQPDGSETLLPVDMMGTVQYAAAEVVDAAERWAAAEQTEEHIWNDNDQYLFLAVKDYRKAKGE